MKARVHINGIIEKEVKHNEDKTVDMIITTEPDEFAREDLKKRGNSIALVRFTETQWKQNKKKFNVGSHVEIIGQYKVAVNKKGTPYVYVAPDNIFKFQQDATNKSKNRVIRNTFEGQFPKKENDRPQYKDWRYEIPDEKYVKIPASKVILNQEVHLNGSIHYINVEKNRNLDNYKIVVRKLEDEKYELIAGIKVFIVGKMLDKEFDCYITELSNEEFVKPYKID